MTTLSLLSSLLSLLRPNIIINYLLHLIFIFSLLCSHYAADLIKKLELTLMVASVLIKTKFGYASISVPKIGIWM